MNEPNTVFCVEWGDSPMSCAGKCFPRLKTFGSAYDARDFFDDIDLKTIFEICVEDQPTLATSATAKKFCYVGERGVDGRIVPAVFLDRANYDYCNHAIRDLKRSELRW